LLKAQYYYFNKFNLDITTVVSTGSLAFKLLRINFLKQSLPILNKDLDNLIRLSYLGGAVHVFKHYGKKVYHYDVNSLYPYAMLRPMPFKFIKVIKDFHSFNLDNFFGFVKVEVQINKSVKDLYYLEKLMIELFLKLVNSLVLIFLKKLKL